MTCEGMWSQLPKYSEVTVLFNTHVEKNIQNSTIAYFATATCAI